MTRDLPDRVCVREKGVLKTVEVEIWKDEDGKYLAESTVTLRPTGWSYTWPPAPVDESHARYLLEEYEVTR
jgi:hypothetical protein